MVEGPVRKPSNKAVENARALRRSMSRPEARLWQVLRTRPEGLKFRRQHPVGNFVVDFYCPAASLALEVDGVAHGIGDAPVHDARRDEWLRQEGLTVLRIPARELYGDIEAAVVHILAHCRR
jgi:very-short-patch-repair endonuclease